MNSIKKNYLYSLVYQIVVLGTPLIITPYTSRILGAEGIGTYSYTYSIANFFALFGILGIKNFGSRSIAVANVGNIDKRRMKKDDLNKTFWNIFFIQVLFSCIMFFIYMCFIFIYVNNNYTLSLIQALVILGSALDITWFFNGLEKFPSIVRRNLIIKTVTIIGIFSLVKNEDDLAMYTMIMASSILLSSLIILPSARKSLNKPNLSFLRVKTYILPIFILFIPVISISVYKVVNKIMLGYYSGFEEVGYFESSEKLVTIPLGIITALGSVMLPRSANLIANGQVEKNKTYITKSIILVLFLSSGMAWGLISISDEFVPFFFGDGFEKVILLIKIIAPSIIFMAWANVIRTQYLIPNGMDKMYISSVILGGIVSLIINFLLIPTLKSEGAVISILTAEATVCIVQTIVIWKYLDFKKMLLISSPFLFFGLAMYLVIESLEHFIYSNNLLLLLLCKISVGAILYSILSLVYYRYIISKQIILS